jgi:hypothetical protein
MGHVIHVRHSGYTYVSLGASHNPRGIFELGLGRGACGTEEDGEKRSGTDGIIT